MVVGAKVHRGPFVVCMWFVCGNFDVSPRLNDFTPTSITLLSCVFIPEVGTFIKGTF